MAIVRLGGTGVYLENSGLAPQASGASAGQILGLTNAVTLQAGEVWTIPAGTYMITPGPYTYIQVLDPITQVFKQAPANSPMAPHFINSDGYNYRLANTTGCPVGALITAVGTAGVVTTGIGTSATGLTVTASSGSSTWSPIIGGAVSLTVATSTGTTTAGSGYLYPPICVIDAPPTGGLQATAIVTSLSSGTIPVANVQVINQGAGYTTAPNVTFINDRRDTVGSGAVVVLTLTGTGLLTGLIAANHGTVPAGLPTLSFSTGTGAATVIMNWTVTGYTTSGAGSSQPANATAMSTLNLVAAQAAPAPVNPLHVGSLSFPRPARILCGVSAGTIIVTGQVVEDGGLGIQQIPTLYTITGYTSTTGTPATFVATVTGGTYDTSWVQPI